MQPDTRTELMHERVLDKAAAIAPSSDGVVVRIAQGLDTRVRVRLVPGRDLKLEPFQKTCSPRQGAERRDTAPVALPAPLLDKLRNADKQMITWLARDPENVRAFLAKPIESLAKAGVQLSRAEQKSLARLQSSVSDASVLAPGVRISAFTAEAHPSGRLGDRPPRPKPTKRGDGECGCEQKE